MNTVPQELDWVEKRAVCTIGKVFNQLCDGIRTDTASLNAIRHSPQDSQFSAEMLSDGVTITVGQLNRIPRARVFIGARENRIIVTQEWDRKEWSGTVGLNNEGRCIIRLEDKTELEQWQFRKKALEGLFFGD